MTDRIDPTISHVILGSVLLNQFVYRSRYDAVHGKCRGNT